jgi:hypothetical protein
MIVFPVVLLASLCAWSVLLYPLAWVLPAERLWAQVIGWSAVGVGTIVALVVTLSICRRIWPKPTSTSHA